MVFCWQPATMVMIYGCFNQHLTERYLCRDHVPIYQSVVINIPCKVCLEPYEEILIGEL